MTILRRRELMGGLAATLLPWTAFAQNAGSEMSEAEARKARSVEILRREGVPYIDTLPLIEPLSQVRFRSTEETANRAIALILAAFMGETGDYAIVQELLQEWEAEPHLTPAEREFIHSRAPSQQDRVQFSWRYEGVFVLNWALGFVEDLGRPDSLVDVAAMATMMRELGPMQFRARARLRDGAQILDLLDLTYRYHWAVVDARINGSEAPGGLDEGVVMERHYALNWLTRYADQEWDDISTDT